MLRYWKKAPFGTEVLLGGQLLHPMTQVQQVYAHCEMNGFMLQMKATSYLKAMLDCACP
jgi:hypothetical protein